MSNRMDSRCESSQVRVLQQRLASPSTPPSPPTGRFHFPSAYTILFALILIIAALTWVIPAGQYQRVASEALGKDVPVAGDAAGKQIDRDRQIQEPLAGADIGDVSDPELMRGTRYPAVEKCNILI